MSARPHQVVLLPGSVLPVGPAYGALLEALGDRVEAVAKELEVYATDEPPPAYRLALEEQGILCEAEAHRFDRFHLVGYSGGGAACLAFAAAHGDRLLSLALLEPAWAGNQRTPAEEALHKRFATLAQLPPEEHMAAFTQLQLAPGVEPPTRPEGPPPPWMAKRPAGIQAFLHAFDTDELDLDALRRFDRPVYFALGGRSHPDYYAEMAKRLADIFPDFTLETFPERHHFDPPHRTEPEKVAQSLLALWARAET
jgi:pimeloyl-ACP methyl ester carboxylesterase